MVWQVLRGAGGRAVYRRAGAGQRAEQLRLDFCGADGVEEMYAILGVWNVDGAGAPVFGPEMRDVLVHEFVHSYANPLIDAHSRELSTAAARIFVPVAPAMRAQAYGDPRIVVYESLVRACVARYLLAHGGEAAARREIQADTTELLFLGAGIV